MPDSSPLLLESLPIKLPLVKGESEADGRPAENPSVGGSIPPLSTSSTSPHRDVEPIIHTFVKSFGPERLICGGGWGEQNCSVLCCGGSDVYVRTDSNRTQASVRR